MPPRDRWLLGALLLLTQPLALLGQRRQQRHYRSQQHQEHQPDQHQQPQDDPQQPPPVRPGESYRVLLTKSPSADTLGMSLYEWRPQGSNPADQDGMRIRVEKVLPGGAAEAGRVLPGDLLLAVGNVRVLATPVTKVAELLQSQPRTVVLDLLRMGGGGDAPAPGGGDDDGRGSLSHAALPAFVSPHSLASRRRHAAAARQRGEPEDSAQAQAPPHASLGIWEPYSAVLRASSGTQPLGFSFRHVSRLAVLGKDVDRVEAGSPAAAAGVRVGDALTHVGETLVKTLALTQIVALIGEARRADPAAVRLRFSRNVTNARVEEAQSQPLEAVQLHVAKPHGRQAYGMRLEKDGAYDGRVVVTEVVARVASGDGEATPAARAGFRPDDILVAFDSLPLDPELPLSRVLAMLRSQPPTFTATVLRVLTDDDRMAREQARKHGAAAAATGGASAEPRGAQQERKKGNQRQEEALVALWERGDSRVTVACMVVPWLDRRNSFAGEGGSKRKPQRGAADKDVPLSTWSPPCAATVMRGALVQRRISGMMPQSHGVAWVSAGRLERLERGRLRRRSGDAALFEPRAEPTILLLPRGDGDIVADLNAVLSSLARTPEAPSPDDHPPKTFNVVAIITERVIADAYARRFARGAVADSPVPVLVVSDRPSDPESRKANNAAEAITMERLVGLATAPRISDRPFFCFQIAAASKQRAAKQEQAKPNVPVFSSKEDTWELKLEDVKAVKPPLERTDVFAGGSFVMEFGRPGKVTHPDDKTPSQDFPLKVPLEKLMTPHAFEVAFQREALCPSCNGRGGLASDMVPCPMCIADNGGGNDDDDDYVDEPGTKRYTRFLGSDYLTSSKVTCPLCQGFGEVPRAGKQCPQCNGKRVLPSRSVMKVDIPAGMPDGHRHVFPAAGNEGPKMSAGDVVLVITTEEHTNFTRRGDGHSGALVLQVNVTLKEALLGFNKTVVTLNGTQVDISRRSGISMFGDASSSSPWETESSSSASSSFVIPGAGLPEYDATEPTGKRRWVRMRRKKKYTPTSNSTSREENATNSSAAVNSSADPGRKKKSRKPFVVAEDLEEGNDQGTPQDGDEWEDVEDWMLTDAERLLEDGEGDGRWEAAFGPMIVEFDIQFPDQLSNSSRSLLNSSMSLFQKLRGRGGESGETAGGG